MRVGVDSNSNMDCCKHELPVRRASAHSEVVCCSRRLARIRNVASSRSNVHSHRLLTVSFSNAEWEWMDVGGRYRRKQSSMRFKTGLRAVVNSRARVSLSVRLRVDIDWFCVDEFFIRMCCGIVQLYGAQSACIWVLCERAVVSVLLSDSL